MRGATLIDNAGGWQCAISIHAPLAGRDRLLACGLRRRVISIHAPLAGRDHVLRQPLVAVLISIHAPLAGRDGVRYLDLPDNVIISIHAPLAGRDVDFCGAGRAAEIFQSTRPLRGAT